MNKVKAMNFPHSLILNGHPKKTKNIETVIKNKGLHGLVSIKSLKFVVIFFIIPKGGN